MVGRRNSRRAGFTQVQIADPGPGSAGLDLKTDASSLPKEAMVRAENVRIDDGNISRRKGARKIAFLGDGTLTDGAKQFTLDADYLEIPAASHLNLPVGGFWRRISFVATRPGAGTAVMLSTSTDSDAAGPHRITLDSTGTLVSQWKDSGGTVHANTIAGIPDGVVVHLLDIFDPASGTWTTYVDGAQRAQQTGLSSTIFPIATSDPWYIGSDVTPTGGAIAGSTFAASVDAFAVGSLRGTDVAGARANGRSLADELRRLTFQTWPNPQSAMIVCHYGLDESAPLSSGIDASRHRNHGTYQGSPSSVTAVAAPCLGGHLVARIQEPDAERVNLVAADGTLYYQVTREGTL